MILRTAIVWLITFLGMVFHGDCRAATLTRIDTAQAIVTVDGQTSRGPVALPYHWDQHHPGRPGHASFELRFARTASMDEPEFGIFIPRIGNTFRILLNGELLASEGDMEQHNLSDHSLLPHIHPIPPRLLQAENVLQIDVKADTGRKGGLAAPLLGPMSEIRAAHQAQLRRYVFGTLFVSLFSLFAGGIAFAMWLTQVDESAGSRRRDPLYGYAALAELAWAAGVIYVLIESPLLPWPWWGMLTILALGVWSCNMALFCIESVGRQQFPHERILRLLLWGLLGTCPFAAYAALGAGYPLALTLWYSALGLTMLALLTLFLVHVRRHLRIPDLLLAASIVVNCAVGLRDLYVVRIQQHYDQFTFIRFSSTLFGFALLYIIVTRFSGNRRQLRELLLTLESKVGERERQLADSFARERELLRERERTAERRQILQDMHDSVGANLSLAIRQIESRKVGPDRLLNTLRESMDQLKLTLDAINLPAGDINSLLANLRYRLAPRIVDAGLEVEWVVSDLPEVSRLDPVALKQLQFILYEAISNVLQHARANRLFMTASSTDSSVILTVSDDGRGFDAPALSRRNGLSQMRRRAQAIGVDLALESRPGRTDVRITVVR